MEYSGLYGMKHFLEWAARGSLEAEMALRLDGDRLPRHIAVIMDGNGRWAQKRYLPRVAGHRAGVESVRRTVEAASRLGVDALTVYAFSVENWKRPKDEVDTLWALLLRYLNDELDNLKRHNIRLNIIGRISGLPKRVRAELDEAMIATGANTGLQLNVALNYGGRSEIIDAVNAALADARVSGEPVQLDEAQFERYLYTAGLPDPDLLIRTSGEVRISNFLLWQIAYTEIWVTEKYWPDFREVDLLEAILDFQSRERRFGGLGAKPDREPELVAAASRPALSEFPE